MMTARHLVRRLLALRSSSPPLGNLMLKEGDYFGRNAQTAVHADFGFAAEVENKMPEAHGQGAVAEQTGLNNNLATLDGYVGGFVNNDGVALDHNGLARQVGVVGHQSLPSQSLTVSGFWVPFKRKPAPQPSPSEAAA